ncbi:MAG: amidohydrolase family protein [Armatimonadota bacterium]|nr:amidohydrolase family protein [Armatimonadota bacterium]
MRRLVGYGLLLITLGLRDTCPPDRSDESVSPLAPRYEASQERALNTRGVYAIRNVTVYPVSAPPIEKATVLIRDGKIAAVGTNLAIPRGATVYEGKGNRLYPGYIDACTTLGLTEIGSIAATIDTTETGQFNPNARAEIALNPDSELIPVTRVNGTTTVVAAPVGGTFSGMGCVMNLDGWTWEEMVIKTPIGLFMNFPAPSGTPNQSAESRRRDWESRMRPINEFLEDARRYLRAHRAAGSEGVPAHERDPRFEAMMPVLEGKLPLFVRVNSALGIQAALRWAEEQRLRLVIVGGSEAHKVADLLREKQVPVILEGVHNLPSAESAPYDEPFALPKRLFEKGVRFCIASNDASNARNLPYHAATAVAHGLPHEEAIKAITLYPAQILGLSHRLGSIEVGKDANLVLLNGDPLDIRTAVIQVWIAGRPIEMTSKHIRLYERYRKRPR